MGRRGVDRRAPARYALRGSARARRLLELHDISLVDAPHPTISGVDTLRLASGYTATTLANAVAGVKWNVGGTLVLGGHIVFPLAKHGLTAPFTPTFGLDTPSDQRVCALTMRQAPSLFWRVKSQRRACVLPLPTFGVQLADPEQFARAVAPFTTTSHRPSDNCCDWSAEKARESARSSTEGHTALAALASRLLYAC